MTKFNPSRSVLVATLLQSDPKRFQGYFRSNLYFIMFTLFFFAWFIPIVLLLPIFAVGAIIGWPEEAMTLIICGVGSVILLAGVNFMRYLAEGILEEEKTYLEEQQDPII